MPHERAGDDVRDTRRPTGAHADPDDHDDTVDAVVDTVKYGVEQVAAKVKGLLRSNH